MGRRGSAVFKSFAGSTASRVLGSAIRGQQAFQDYALHIMPYVRDGHKVKDASLDAHGNSREACEAQIFEAIRSMGDEEVQAGCRRCIKAAMQSTVALDGVVGRLIVGNIHGVAHG